MIEKNREIARKNSTAGSVQGLAGESIMEHLEIDEKRRIFRIQEEPAYKKPHFKKPQADFFVIGTLL